MPSRLSPREDGISLPSARVEPIGGMITDVFVSLISIAILSAFITQRYLAITNWRKLPLIVWLVFAIFVDSWLFVFITAILKHGAGINSSFELCSSAILLCLICYVSSKILVYFFLVEKAFVVRNGAKPRLQSKLYCFNSFGMLGVYITVSILNFIFRITRLENGLCIIGMKKIAMVPLITFDLLVNIYLTILFLIPLRCLYSFKDMPRTPANIRLRTVAMRTFVGALSTTVSSVVNLTVLMALDGEPGWVCLLCCNCDILFSAVIIQWVTSQDNAATASAADQNSLPTYHGDSSRDRTAPSRHRDFLGGGAAGGILRNMSNTIKYEEMDVTAYPLRPTNTFRPTELPDSDEFEEGYREHGRLCSDEVSTTNLLESPEPAHEGAIGVVEKKMQPMTMSWATGPSPKQHM
ncbi:hypothetical protein SCAR479_04462 [Seiridium cardinale]|uniref:Uncharacterized protein n=1 Tax=Seiridium cardinale TaxID=138064 RepID=A0ABR2XYF3_9PEZI